MDPNQKSLERGFALQKYLLLHSQHESLQRNLSQMTSSSRSPERNPYRQGSISSSPGSEDGHSVSSSPTNHPRHHYRSGSFSQHRQRCPANNRRTSSLPTVVDESIMGEIAEEEMKMRDVNLQIKSTLTELLNCESVRNDGRYRMWVQTRLMDAEKELRGERRRRRNDDVNNGMIYN